MQLCRLSIKVKFPYYFLSYEINRFCKIKLNNLLTPNTFNYIYTCTRILRNQVSL